MLTVAITRIILCMDRVSVSGLDQSIDCCFGWISLKLSVDLTADVNQFVVLCSFRYSPQALSVGR